MKILLLTDDAISFSHGTGAVLLKILGNHPPSELAHGYLNRVSDPALEQAYQIHTDPDAIDRLPVIDRFWRQLAAIKFQPELIYANFYGLRGLRILHALLTRAPYLPPVIQHFQDLRPDSAGELLMLLRTMQPKLTRIWALTPTMARFLETQIGRQVEVFISFGAPLPARPRTIYRAFGPDFKAVMLGNVWLPEVVEDLRRAWRHLIMNRPGLGPIQWFGHPFALNHILQNGQVPGDEIRPMGFAPNLEDALVGADLAILPFNRKEPPENNYARFSLPSRLSELTMAGLPVFALACSGTTVWDFIHINRIGRCACPMNPARMSELLMEFAMDQDARTACGRNALSLAYAEFDIEKLRRKYFNAFYATLTPSENR